MTPTNPQVISVGLATWITGIIGAGSGVITAISAAADGFTSTTLTAAAIAAANFIVLALGRYAQAASYIKAHPHLVGEAGKYVASDELLGAEAVAKLQNEPTG